MPLPPLELLEQTLTYQFRLPELLLAAVSHKSYVNETPSHPHGDNERLEFLGDAVLDLVVSDRMFSCYPQLSEGEMTRVRAEVVSEKKLAALARRLELGRYLLLGKGERMTGGEDKDSLLSDALEAIIGAVYQDGGFAAAEQVVLGLLAEPIDQAVSRKRGLDYKTRLQELVQLRFGVVPVYVLAETSGPDHSRTFRITVAFAGQQHGPGEGRTKKKAEQEAARQALVALEG